MKTNNIIFLKIRLLFCLFALSTTLWSCNDTPDYNDAYDNTTATTAVAQKLVAGTGLIGHMIDDRTWTVTDGVEATEIAYVSYEGYTTKMFVVEVDLSNPAISIAAWIIRLSPALHLTVSAEPTSGRLGELMRCRRQQGLGRFQR